MKTVLDHCVLGTLYVNYVAYTWCFVIDLIEICTFYPRDVVVSGVFATATCPSVCPSVTAGIVSKRLNLS